MRWLWWFALVPQTWLCAGLLQDLGLPSFDMSVMVCLFLAWFAQRDALPWLLLGCAVGRALVDEAALPVHVLVLGVPIAVLLPLRTLFVAQRWLWQAVAAALLAVVLPQLAYLLGSIFGELSTGSVLRGWNVVWSALLTPPVLLSLRHLPPFRAFAEPDTLLGGTR